MYRYFGSGSVHGTYAIFKKYAATYNNNVEIGLIQAAETRMGGYFYAFYRLLRLKKALRQTVVSKEWENVVVENPKLKQTIEMVVNNDDFFNLVKMVVLVLYPVIKCLQLADTNKPGMDKI